MNCIKCGANLGENDVFCSKCGTRVQKAEGYNTNIENEGMNYNYERSINQQSNVYSQQYRNNTSNKDTVKVCVIILIIVVILVAVCFGFYSVISILNKKNKMQEASGTTTSSKTQSEDLTSTSQVSNTQKTSTYKVNYAGFKLYIPDDLIYEFNTTNDAINIGDALSSWLARLTIQKLPFQQLKQNRSYIRSNLEEYLSSYNASVSNPTLETIDGIEFILFEIDLAGTHELLAVSGLNSMYTACTEIINENNDYDKNILKDIIPILKTAEYEGESRNLETNGKIKTTDINKALQKAIDEQTNE